MKMIKKSFLARFTTPSTTPNLSFIELGESFPNIQKTLKDTITKTTIYLATSNITKKQSQTLKRWVSEKTTSLKPKHTLIDNIIKTPVEILFSNELEAQK